MTEQQLLLKWRKMREPLAAAYEAKDPTSATQLQQAIRWYKQLLEIGGTQKLLHQNMEKYRYAPLNGEERLAFVESRPRSKQAYIQLAMLFQEAEKKWLRLQAQS